MSDSISIQEENSHLTQLCKHLQDNLLECTSKLDRVAVEKMERQEEMLQLQNEIAVLRHKMNQESNMTTKLIEFVANETAKAMALEDQLAIATNDVKKNENDDSWLQLMKENDELQKNLTELQMSFAALNKEYTLAMEKLTEKDEHLTELQVSFAALDKEHMLTTDQLIEKDQNLTELQLSFAALQNNCTEQLMEKDQKLEELHTLLISLQKDYTFATEQITEKDEHLTKLQKNVTELQMSLAALQKNGVTTYKVDEPDKQLKNEELKGKNQRIPELSAQPQKSMLSETEKTKEQLKQLTEAISNDAKVTLPCKFWN